MNVLFWNLGKNANEKWIKEIIRENDVDIALFAEYQHTSFSSVITELASYTQHDGYNGCDKITLLCKQSIVTQVRREQNRYTIYSCIVEGTQYNIAGVHLPPPPNNSADTRKLVIRNLVQDIEEQERILQNRQTIVIGDFNCNPFDEEVVQKDAFNAVLFKPLIDRQETITYCERRWRRFYNPIIHFLSEDTHTYGSIYYSSGSAPIYWNSFDQVLVRKGLVDNISSLKYINTINGNSLIAQIKPIESISDHLPLLINISKGV